MGRRSRKAAITDSLFSRSIVASVEVRLGATALIRTPREPYSSARERVKLVRKGRKKEKGAYKERKKRDGIQTAELNRRDQVTATVPGPVSFEKREQRSIHR
jgi:hypothetical protein